MISSKQILENNDKKASCHTEVAACEPRNIACLVAYQVVARIGWIFKTETVIMPAVLDACVASGLLRGFLPVLNRVGTSLFLLAICRSTGCCGESEGGKGVWVACFAQVFKVWPPGRW